MGLEITARSARLALAAVFSSALVAGLGACVRESAPPYPNQRAGQFQAPQAQAMEEPRALGLWKSSFGAVKIEEDLQKGAPGGGELHGVWVYQRNGQDVVGYFAGHLGGNVLQFTWQEPSTPSPLTGAGYLVFDPQGQRFNGRWWTYAKDRVGEWNGWRQGAAQPAPSQPQVQPYGQPQPYGGQGYGGQGYGGQTYGGTYAPPPPPNSY